MKVINHYGDEVLKVYGVDSTAAHQTVRPLFATAPPQWGLRGDPYLWDELSDILSDTPLPQTESELVRLVEAGFERLTGHAMSEPDTFVVERYAHGGMSSGGVSPDFWRDEAMPLLLRRFREGE